MEQFEVTKPSSTLTAHNQDLSAGHGGPLEGPNAIEINEAIEKPIITSI